MVKLESEAKYPNAVVLTKADLSEELKEKQLDGGSNLS